MALVPAGRIGNSRGDKAGVGHEAGLEQSILERTALAAAELFGGDVAITRALEQLKEGGGTGRCYELTEERGAT